MKHWISKLGFKTTLVLAIGKFFDYILQSVNYYTIHLPLKNLILVCNSHGLDAKKLNETIYINSPKLKQIYLLRNATSDINVFIQVLIEKEYLPLVELIKNLNAQNTIHKIIDAGANIGLTSLFFKQYYPQAKIITIEPDSANYHQQVNNIKINNLSSSIIPLNKALWRNSVDKLNIFSNFRDGAAWARSVEIDSENPGEIESISISDICQQYAFNELIDILKVDIEGSENIIFNDDNFMMNLINKVRFLSVEIHDECNDRKELLMKLEASHFQVITKGETTFCINKNLL